MALLAKYLHAAHVRLDVPVRGVGAVPAAAQTRLEDASLDAFDKLVETAIDHEVDLVLLGGDTVRADDRSLRARLRLESGLATLAEAGVVIAVAPGPLDPPALWHDLALPDEVWLLDRDPALLETDRAVIELRLADPNARDKAGPRDAFRIGLVPPSGPVRGSVGVSGRRRFDPPETFAGFDGRIDYWGVAEAHAATVKLEHSLVHDPGPLCPLTPGHTGACGATLVDAQSDGGIRTTAVPLSPVRCLEGRIEVGTKDDIDVLSERMHAELHRMDLSADVSVVTWRLSGRGPALEDLQLDGTWGDLVELIDDEAGRDRVHRLHLEPWGGAEPGSDHDEIAALLSDEFREHLQEAVPSPASFIDEADGDVRRLLAAAAKDDRLGDRLRQLGTTAFAAG